MAQEKNTPMSMKAYPALKALFQKLSQKNTSVIVIDPKASEAPEAIIR